MCEIARARPRRSSTASSAPASVSVAMARRGVRQHRRRGHPAVQLRHPARLHARRARGSRPSLERLNAAPAAARVHQRELRRHVLHRGELPPHGRHPGGDRSGCACAGEITRGRARHPPGELPPGRRPGGQHDRPVRRVPEEHRGAATCAGGRHLAGRAGADPVRPAAAGRHPGRAHRRDREGDMLALRPGARRPTSPTSIRPTIIASTATTTTCWRTSPGGRSRPCSARRASSTGPA